MPSEKAASKSISKRDAKKKSDPPSCHLPQALPYTLRKDIPNAVRRFVLDLDLPPIERYRCIIEDFKEHLGAVDAFVEGTAKSLGGSVGLFALKCLQGVLNMGNKLSLVYYSDELNAIAELSGMPLGRVVLMQLVYEASALCTSVVVPRTVEGRAGHIRTMDWEMGMLKDVTIEVEVRQNGVTKAIGTTWAGYVGLLTGVAVRGTDQARDGFSVSVNFRSVGSGTIATNLKCALKRAWPIGFLVRETLMRAGNYSTAASWLTHSKLIAPCYFAVCGAKPMEACLITRCRDTHHRTLLLGERCGAASGPSAASSVLVQPNMDHWSSDPNDDIMHSRERRCAAREAMVKLIQKYSISGVTHEREEESEPPAVVGATTDSSLIPLAALWKAMSAPPIMNDVTIYGTYMSPFEGHLETRLPISKKGSTTGRFVF